MNMLRNSAYVCLCVSVANLAGASRDTWIATWASSPQSANPSPDEPLLNVNDQTVRERVRVSMGGPQIRIRLSNEYGSSPLLIGSATVAAPKDPSSVQAGSIKTLTFGGHNSITIPSGAPILSDPVAFSIVSGGEISVSLYFPARVSTPTLHAIALKHTVVSQRGDFTHLEKIEAGAVSESSLLISAVLVPDQPSHRLVVAFGDSITDGAGSTVEADSSWPSDLVRRLVKMPEAPQVAVVNEGIAGNRLLRDGLGSSALARFDRDALALPGVTHIVLLEGINDIGFPGAKRNGSELADATDTRTPEELIDAYLQLISRAHDHGIKLIGATLTPFEGTLFPGYYSGSKEATRQVINKWIRTSGWFDGVIDFDAILRDPDHPSRLLPAFASKDHLHPNDTGYRALAAAIDLDLFK